MPWWGDLLVAAALLVAALGCIVPLLPGGLLALGAVSVWCLIEGGAVGWSVFAAAVLLITIGQVVKYAWPGRTMTREGVAGRSLIIGGLLGIVGFFVIPVVGLPVGFIAGIYAAELTRSRDAAIAWASTWAALKATGWSMLIELASVLLTAAAWTSGVVLTA